MQKLGRFVKFILFSDAYGKIVWGGGAVCETGSCFFTVRFIVLIAAFSLKCILKHEHVVIINLKITPLV